MKLRLATAALAALFASSVHAEPKAGEVWTEPKTGMQFVWMPAGCFDMGSADGEKNEMPVHRVCVKGFWIGKYEVTQAQYQQIMNSNPSKFRGSNKPVDSVSWKDAKSFGEEMSYVTGTKVRMPSEAEWEYACRAGGAHDPYCGGGGRAERMGWFAKNSDKATKPVGELAANDWGVHDMSGNLWEWTQDCSHDNYNGAPADGSAWKDGSCDRKMLRGGSWFNEDTKYLRAASRIDIPLDPKEDSAIGFRVVRVLP